MEEITTNGWNLNISRSVEPVEQGESVMAEDAISSLKSALQETYAAEDWLKELLRAGLMD